MSERDDGFTIVEALCAFAILAVVLVALYSVGGTAIRMSGATTDADRAALLAQSKLDELSASRFALPHFETGTFDGTPIRWTLSAHDVTGGAAGGARLRLQDVQLSLTWPARLGFDELVVDTRHLGAATP
jgi:Tfp pilus assembly protein PilV